MLRVEGQDKWKGRQRKIDVRVMGKVKGAMQDIRMKDGTIEGGGK